MLKDIQTICVLTFSLLILGSCATQKSQSNLPEEAEVASEEEKDRGFNPCLVNPKLPVCTKKSG